MSAFAGTSKENCNLYWHERRRLEKEREREDANRRGWADIGESNVGFKPLKQMGYKPVSTLFLRVTSLALLVAGFARDINEN